MRLGRVPGDGFGFASRPLLKRYSNVRIEGGTSYIMPMIERDREQWGEWAVLL